MKTVISIGCILAVATLLLVAVEGASNSTDYDIRYHLGSKTPYWPQQNYSTYTPPPDGCRAVHFNLLARHGSRRPSSGDVKQFNKFHNILKGHYDAMDAYPWMKNWTNPFDAKDADYLTVQGEFEHYYMAKRALAYYKDLLTEHPFEPSRYDLHSTEISRAAMSANAYGFGLFEGTGQVGPSKYDPFLVITNNATTDNELRFFKTCPTTSTRSRTTRPRRRRAPCTSTRSCLCWPPSSPSGSMSPDGTSPPVTSPLCGRSARSNSLPRTFQTSSAVSSTRTMRE
jgi:multiple inositol-polyphosphate phosphatase/2,3-bisphosphoglycerate 3-phosphatase